MSSLVTEFHSFKEFLMLVETLAYYHLSHLLKLWGERVLDVHGDLFFNSKNLSISVTSFGLVLQFLKIYSLLGGNTKDQSQNFTSNRQVLCHWALSSSHKFKIKKIKYSWKTF